MNEYALITEWLLRAPLQTVWDVLCHSETWPQWWTFVKRVEIIEPGETDGLHGVRRYWWKTRLPYELCFDLSTTLIDAPHRIEAEVNGDLCGRALCALSEDGAETRVRIEWHVRTCKRWMNWLAPLVRPVFVWNHREVMKRGGMALTTRLEALPVPAHD